MSLTEGEKIAAMKHRVDENLLAKVKHGWEDSKQEILEGLKKYGGLDECTINYKPIDESLPGAYNILEVYTDKGEVNFMTPNSINREDVWPTLEGKIGALGHEILGHIADDQEYYVDEHKASIVEYNKFMASEQRANLRCFHSFPKETMIHVEGIVDHLARFYVGGKDNIGPLYDSFVGIETLGRMGMHRTGDMMGFLYDLKDTQKVVLHDMFKLGKVYLFTGIVTPPTLNNSGYMGIKKQQDYSRFTDSIARYLNDGVTAKSIENSFNHFKSFLNNKFINPEYSVDVLVDEDDDGVVIDVDKALLKHKEFQQYVGKRFKDNDYNLLDDLLEASERIVNKLSE